MQQGLTHIYCGEGKGKTTAALGLALRAIGHGWRVLLVQFLKAATTGELKAIEQLAGFSVLRGDKGRAFALQMDDAAKSELIAQHNQLLATAIQTARRGECNLLILDEAVGAFSRGLVDRQSLLQFMRNKPSCLELVLTGRHPDAELLGLADYVSEVKKIRHPFDRGIVAREGIEL